MSQALAALLAAALLPGPEDTPGPPLPAPDRGVVSVVLENDLFGGTDRNYTNGLRAEWVRPAEEAPGGAAPALRGS